MNNIALKKDTKRIANQHKKKCLTSLVIREIQIKIEMRDYFTAIIMAIMEKKNKPTRIISDDEDMEKLQPLCTDRNVKWCSHSGEQDGSSSKKLRITTQSSNVTSGNVPKRRRKAGLRQIFVHSCL